MMRPAWARTTTDDVIASWVASVIAGLGADRVACARVALSALGVVSPLLPPDDEVLAIQSAALAEKRDAVTRWIADPTTERQQRAQHLLDPTRQLHAWSDFPIIVDAWILETADFALHAVWSGSATWYLDPPSPRICAELATICARRALVAAGREPLQSIRELAIAMAAQLGVPVPALTSA